MNRRRFPFAYFISIIFIALLSGCSTLGESPLPGFIVTYTKFPYDIDLNNTPVADIEQDAKIVRVTEPFTGYGMYAEVMSNSIGDIAEENGLTEVYFADMEVLNILGILKYNKIYIYGK